jgi:ABC-2 type transport system permease protein
MTMATLAASPRRPGAPTRACVFSLLVRRALRDGRVRTIGFLFVFALVSFIEPVGYRHTYPTLVDRIRFSQSFAHNKAVVLFYGKAYDLLTVGGYSAWRVGGTLSIFAAVFGLLAAVRGLRAEEDAGRSELLLALPVSRATAYRAWLAAACCATLLLGLASLAGLVAGGLSPGASAYLALSEVSVVPVFLGVGALASQLAPTRRSALELGGAALALAFLLRVIADTSSTAGWLTWLTPLGWTEQLRPFTGVRPIVLLLPLAASVLLLGGAAAIALRRDVGSGLLSAHDRARPRMRLLSSPTAQALRGEWLGVLVWAVSVGALGLVIGIVSKSVSSLGVSPRLERELAKLGVGTILTPRAYIAFAFSFFLIALSALAVSQIAAARREEESERLETILAQPVGRSQWLGGRLGLALGALGVTSFSAAVLTWLGAVSQGVSLSLLRMLEAGANLLPVSVLFLGIAVLAYAVIPRAASAVAYGLLVALYLWQLFGKLLGAPSWLVDATPFAHVGLVPAQSFRPGAAAVMVGIGLLAGLIAILAFRRRDLVGG